MTRALRWADVASLETVSSTWIAKSLSSSPNTSSRWVLALLVVSAARAQETPGSFETTVRSERRVAPGQVTLHREALDEQGAQSAADALQWDAAFTAPAGARGEHIFTLRGFDQRQTAVLLDGAPFELPYDGQLDLAMVPAALVDRVELLESPGSVSVGPNGLGGAVNIVTRRAGGGALARAWGEVSHLWGRELRFEHSLDLGRVAWTVSGGHLEQPAWPLASTFAPTAYERGPLRANSDKTLDHVALAVAVRLTARQSLSVTAWLFDGARGTSPSTLDDRPRFWRFTVWRALNVQAAHRWEGETVSVDTLAWARNFDNLLDAYDNGLYLSQTTPRAFSSWYHDPVVGLRSRARAHRRAVGVGACAAVARWAVAGARRDEHPGRDERALRALDGHRHSRGRDEPDEVAHAAGRAPGRRRAAAGVAGRAGGQRARAAPHRAGAPGERAGADGERRTHHPLPRAQGAFLVGDGLPRAEPRART